MCVNLLDSSGRQKKRTSEEWFDEISKSFSKSRNEDQKRCSCVSVCLYIYICLFGKHLEAGRICPLCWDRQCVCVCGIFFLLNFPFLCSPVIRVCCRLSAGFERVCVSSHQQHHHQQQPQQKKMFLSSIKAIFLKMCVF